MESNLVNPNSPTRYPVTEKITLYVSQLEDELRHYKGAADYMGRQRDVPDSAAKMINDLAAEVEDLKKQRLGRVRGQPRLRQLVRKDIWQTHACAEHLAVYDLQAGLSMGRQGRFWDAGRRILYAEHLFKQIAEEGIEGDVVEFGTYYGHWVQVICETLERNSWRRKVWGFDSFEGLPKPDVQLDPDCWTEGMYPAPFDEVRARLQVESTPLSSTREGLVQ